MPNPGFLLDVLQRQQGRGSSILVAKVCLVSQFVRQAVVVVVVVVVVTAGDATVVGYRSQGHRTRNRVLVSTAAATRQFVRRLCSTAASAQVQGVVTASCFEGWWVKRRKWVVICVWVGFRIAVGLLQRVLLSCRGLWLEVVECLRRWRTSDARIDGLMND
jgi:hypothetical protein